MINRLLLIGICFWLGSGAYGQDSIIPQQIFTGIVRDSGNRPLPASIHIAATGKHLPADSNGRFTVSLAPGNYRIRITHTGYHDLIKNISIPGIASFTLIPSETELEQVVVTAVASASHIRRTPVSIAIVSQKEMNRNTSSNVIDAVLKSVPGISAITTGPNISKPLIRGLGYTRVLTLYDGLRQEGQQWGEEHGVEIDQYGLARAEVVKGPASLMYGSDAIAGVVNLIPALPAANDHTLHGDAVTEYQSNNGMMGISASMNQRNKAWMWGMRLSGKHAGNYRNAVDGRVYNTGFKEWNTAAMIGMEKTNSRHYWHFNSYNNLQEIPDGSRDSLTRDFTYQVNEAATDNIRNRPRVPDDRLFTYNISPLHQHIQHTRLYYKSLWRIGKGELNALTGFQQSRRREYNHPSAVYQPGLDLRLNTYNYELKYGFPEWNGMRLSFGVNGMYQVNRNRDATDFPIPDYRLFDIGAYTIVKKEFSKWVITGGIRIDSRKVHWNDFYTHSTASGFMKQAVYPDTALATLNFPAYRKTFSGISGSMGVVFNASGNVTIKANLARGYRCPSIPEIGSDGLDPGARIYYIGNRNFAPEFNWQPDIGLFLDYPDADISLEFFHNSISNYIFLQKLFDANGRPLEIVPGNFTYQYRQGSAKIYGAEAGWTIHPRNWKWLQLQQSLSFIRGRNTDNTSLKLLGDDAKYLPLIPPLKTVSRLRISSDGKKTGADRFIQAELETNATQNRFYAVDNTETATAGYALVNISAGLGFTNQKGKNNCHLSLTINNLFNTAYQSHLNRLKYFEYYRQSPDGRYGIYNMGRNIAVKLTLLW